MTALEGGPEQGPKPTRHKVDVDAEPPNRGYDFSFRSNLRYDLPAGLVVFLVALPLCLGISLASGTPLLSGLIAGVVAGLVITPLSGSPLSVSGPAAGLTVIVLNANKTLGSFRAFLVSVVLAGGIQLALGFLKAGTIANYFPSSVIKGMLAAIGIVLVLKQIPHAFGYDEDFEGDEGFFQVDQENTFSELVKSINQLSPGAIVIALLCLGILFAWSRPQLKKLTVVPAPLLVVIVGIGLNALYGVVAPQLKLGSKHLVALPIASSTADLAKYITLPDFSQITNPKVFTVAITLAIVASLETLLSVEAVDKLDPFKRNSAPNRELKAQGLGNVLSGLIGGLPITAVIVRSAANVNAGGRTKTAGMAHGALLLLSVLLIPGILNRIPLSALAAVLIFTGFKLASPKLMKGMFKAGLDQFIPFVVTIVAILFTDLLKGIGIGMAVGVFYILRANYKTPYFFHKEEHPRGQKIRLVLSEHVSFLNKASILLTLKHLPNDSIVEIDGTGSQYIDYDVVEILHDFKESARKRGIEVELKNIPDAPTVTHAH
jgi:MFS superfamily sulfate permease-like transporter